MSGRTNRLDATFARIAAEGRIGFFPYLTAGYPDRELGARLLDVLADSGADGIELGIPFSDPLADGVSIQRAGSRALAGGMTLTKALDLVADFRARHETPVVMMSYVNPLMAYGIERLCIDAARLGVDGFIVPDVPFEESGEIADACAGRGLHLIPMVAPTSDDGRLRAIGERARGFIYCVALLGTTGARTELSGELGPLAARVRAITQTPLVAGFGISRPEHVAALVGTVDGAIVGGAIADLIDRTPPEEVEAALGAYVRSLRAVTGGVASGAQ